MNVWAHKGNVALTLRVSVAGAYMSAIQVQKPALVLIDVQQGFLHPTHWGIQRSNPAFESNISKILSAFRQRKDPIFHVAHHSVDPASQLHPGNCPSQVDFLPFAAPLVGEPVFIKNVNSAFIGTQLEQAIRDAGITELFIAGLTTDHCVSTSTRMAANLHVVGENGKVYLVGDAVANWEKGKWDAETVHQVHLASLDGEFAEVVKTEEVVRALAVA